jgi:hypothetical protein
MVSDVMAANFILVHTSDKKVQPTSCSNLYALSFVGNRFAVCALLEALPALQDVSHTSSRDWMDMNVGYLTTMHPMNQPSCHPSLLNPVGTPTWHLMLRAS